MHIIKNEIFISESIKFKLKYSCEDCIFFCPKRQSCQMLYPTLSHQKKYVENCKTGERIYFCKMFEAL